MNTWIKSELDNEITKIQTETGYKKNLIKRLISEAEELTEENGIELNTMHLSNQLIQFLNLPLSILMKQLNRGVDLTVLDSYPDEETDDEVVNEEDIENQNAFEDLMRNLGNLQNDDENDENDENDEAVKVVECRIRYQCIVYIHLADASGNTSLLWRLDKIENGNRYALINNEWEHYFCINDMELCACSKCPKKGDCAMYDSQVFADKLGSIALTPDQVDDCFSSEPLSTLLSAAIMTHDVVDDEEWARIKYNNKKLVELNTECWNGELLIFMQIKPDWFVLTPSKTAHHGFVIGYKKGRYELYQYMSGHAISEFLSLDSPTIEKQYLKLVDTTRDVNDVKIFIVNYADRMCDDKPIYTIPLSFRHAVRLRGVLNGHFDEMAKGIEDMERMLTPQEMENAEAFLHELHQYISKKKSKTGCKTGLNKKTVENKAENPDTNQV